MYNLPEIERKSPRPPYKKPDSVRELERLANLEAIRLHPNIDPRYLAPRLFRDDKAGPLTACVVKYIELMGGWASRVNSTGIYDKNLQRFRTSTQKRGIADVIATYKGLSLQVEIKIGRDKMSEDQMKVQQQVQQAGGMYFVAHDFTEFKQWFDNIST
jgi:hypothetical protein